MTFEFSPMPPVKTIASAPPRVTRNAPPTADALTGAAPSRKLTPYHDMPITAAKAALGFLLALRALGAALAFAGLAFVLLPSHLSIT